MNLIIILRNVFSSISKPHKIQLLLSNIKLTNYKHAHIAKTLMVFTISYLNFGIAVALVLILPHK